MTLPKGYTPNTPSRDDGGGNDRPTSTGRPRKKGSRGKAIFFTILFLISLYFFATSVINYIESGKELDEQKKVVEKTRSEYAKTYMEIYGKLPPNSPP